MHHERGEECEFKSRRQRAEVEVERRSVGIGGVRNRPELFNALLYLSHTPHTFTINDTELLVGGGEGWGARGRGREGAYQVEGGQAKGDHNENVPCCSNGEAERDQEEGVKQR